MTRKKRRLTTIALAGAVLAVAAALVLVALNDRIVFFYHPAISRRKRHRRALGCGLAGWSPKARSNKLPTGA
jgi:cytochrome c-type biogenesis protein CcmE